MVRNLIHKKNFIYMPLLGFIEAGENTDDAIERINRAEAKLDVADKKKRKLLERQNPGCKIEKWGEAWTIIPEDSPLLDE